MSLALNIYMEKRAKNALVKAFQKWGPEKFRAAYQRAAARTPYSAAIGAIDDDLIGTVARWHSKHFKPSNVVRRVPRYKPAPIPLTMDQVRDHADIGLFGKTMRNKPQMVVNVPKDVVVPQAAINRAGRAGLTRRQVARRTGGVVDPHNTVLKGLHDPTGKYVNSVSALGADTQMNTLTGVKNTGTDFFVTPNPRTASNYARAVPFNGEDPIGSGKGLAGIVDVYNSGKFKSRVRQGTRSANSTKMLYHSPPDVTKIGIGNAPFGDPVFNAKNPDVIRKNIMGRRRYQKALAAKGLTPEATAGSFMPDVGSNRYEDVVFRRPGARKKYDARYLITNDGDAIPYAKVKGEYLRARRAYRKSTTDLMAQRRKRIDSMLANGYATPSMIQDAVNPSGVRFNY